MKNDFITLQCPNCGGNLEIGKNVTEYKCENCGMEHLVRQSASGITLEAHARCPICKRKMMGGNILNFLGNMPSSKENDT